MKYVLKRTAMVLTAALIGFGCAPQPGEAQVSGLTVVTFNYSDEAIFTLRVNGEMLGGSQEAVRPGGVTGGGGSCCVSLDLGSETLSLQVEPAVADPYTVDAVVEHPITNYPHYVVFHILPKRKVVIAVTARTPLPRADLLDERLQELGIEKQDEFPAHLMATGPDYDID